MAGACAVRAVFLDAGGTLLHARPSVGEVYAEILAGFGRRVEGSELELAFRSAWERATRATPAGRDRFAAAGGSRRFWRRLLDETLRAAGERRGLEDAEFEAIHSEFRDARRFGVFPDVAPALAGLAARGLVLGIISNWDERLPQVMAGLDLAASFTVWAVSAIEGVEKPDPEIFARACARAGVRPGEALHVGDSPVDDWDGARSAGLGALLLDRSGRRRGTSVVHDLGAILDRLPSAAGSRQ